MINSASNAITRFVSLHEHNLAQKAEIVVEHFRTHVAHKVAGQAKAMVVCSSRPHALRFYHALLGGEVNRPDRRWSLGGGWSTLANSRLVRTRRYASG